MVAVARAILGLGAGFMFAVPLGLFALYVPDDLRPRAFGLNAAMWGVAAIIGPALGAALTGTLGWRWVFWINLPMIAAIAWSARLAMSAHPERPAEPEHRPLNLIGPVLLGLSVAPLLASEHWIAPLAIVPAVLFFFHERRTRSPGVHAPQDLPGRERRGVRRGRRLPGRRGVPAGAAPGRAGRADLGGRLGAGAGDDRLDDRVDERRPAGRGLRRADLLGDDDRLRRDAGDGRADRRAGAADPRPTASPGLGMGVASPALFTAVLADKREGREGRPTSSIPLARQAGAGVGTAIAGLVFESSLSESTIRAAEKAGAHVPAVIPGARHTYVAAAALGAIGVIASRWLRDEREPATAEQQHEMAAG